MMLLENITTCGIFGMNLIWYIFVRDTPDAQGEKTQSAQACDPHGPLPSTLRDPHHLQSLVTQSKSI